MSNRLEDFFPGKARQKVKFVFSTLVVKPLVVPALIYLHHLLRKVFISRAFEQLKKKSRHQRVFRQYFSLMKYFSSTYVLGSKGSYGKVHKRRLWSK